MSGSVVVAAPVDAVALAAAQSKWRAELLLLRCPQKTREFVEVALAPPESAPATVEFFERRALEVRALVERIGRGLEALPPAITSLPGKGDNLPLAGNDTNMVCFLTIFLVARGRFDTVTGSTSWKQSVATSLSSRTGTVLEEWKGVVESFDRTIAGRNASYQSESRAKAAETMKKNKEAKVGAAAAERTAADQLAAARAEVAQLRTSLEDERKRMREDADFLIQRERDLFAEERRFFSRQIDTLTRILASAHQRPQLPAQFATCGPGGSAAYYSPAPPVMSGADQFFAEFGEPFMHSTNVPRPSTTAAYSPPHATPRPAGADSASPPVRTTASAATGGTVTSPPGAHYSLPPTLASNLPSSTTQASKRPTSNTPLGMQQPQTVVRRF